ncbi:MAG: phage integrase N-terminal SAM-like domain-containing protein [Vicinamibacterales bacterium]
MLEDMQLRGLSARTQECYVAAVRQLATPYQVSPAALTDDQLRQYFLYFDEREAGRSDDGHDCPVRDPVPVRADAEAALADTPVRAPRARDAVAGGAQS